MKQYVCIVLCASLLSASDTTETRKNNQQSNEQRRGIKEWDDETVHEMLVYGSKEAIQHITGQQDIQDTKSNKKK